MVYTQPVAAQTYYAPTTPSIRMIPGDQYAIAVTLNNPTGTVWRASDWVLSYHWTLPDGTDVTNGGNQLDSPLPADVAPGQAVNLNIPGFTGGCGDSSCRCESPPTNNGCASSPTASNPKTCSASGSTPSD